MRATHASIVAGNPTFIVPPIGSIFLWMFKNGTMRTRQKQGVQVSLRCPEEDAGMGVLLSSGSSPAKFPRPVSGGPCCSCHFVLVVGVAWMLPVMSLGLFFFAVLKPHNPTSEM